MESKISELSSDQKLKVATFLEVRRVVEEVGENIQFAFSKQSMDLIAELVWRKMKVSGTDLEAFAKHAKRSTVNAEDVKLLARRNTVLKTYMSEMADELKSKKDQQKKKTTKKDSALQPPKDIAVAGPSTSSFYNKVTDCDMFEFRLRPDSPILLSD